MGLRRWWCHRPRDCRLRCRCLDWRWRLSLGKRSRARRQPTRRRGMRRMGRGHRRETPHQSARRACGSARADSGGRAWRQRGVAAATAALKVQLAAAAACCRSCRTRRCSCGRLWRGPRSSGQAWARGRALRARVGQRCWRVVLACGWGLRLTLRRQHEAAVAAALVRWWCGVTERARTAARRCHCPRTTLGVPVPRLGRQPEQWRPALWWRWQLRCTGPSSWTRSAREPRPPRSTSPTRTPRCWPRLRTPTRRPRPLQRESASAAVGCRRRHRRDGTQVRCSQAAGTGVGVAAAAQRPRPRRSCCVPLRSGRWRALAKGPGWARRGNMSRRLVAGLRRWAAAAAAAGEAGGARSGSVAASEPAPAMWATAALVGGATARMQARAVARADCCRLLAARLGAKTQPRRRPRTPV
mmetsp:Transcript_3210/g.9987  ORF Transcript_3210/g.9987 Transcript_3210/m.9987 type:complete len:413 (-) Transcript_3210:1742-2980(-)